MRRIWRPSGIAVGGHKRREEFFGNRRGAVDHFALARMQAATGPIDQSDALLLVERQESKPRRPGNGGN